MRAEALAMPDARHDLPRTLLAILFIGGLIGATLWILQPFLVATVWATTIVVATWPILRALEDRLGGRRWLAVAAMSAALLTALVLPFALAIGTVLANIDRIVGWARSLAGVRLPGPPTWIGGLPVVGAYAVQAWDQVASLGSGEIAAQVGPYLGDVARWFATHAGGVGMVVVQSLLTVAIAAILYAHGEGVAAGLGGFARRLAGPHGENAVLLAGQAIRGVALGVVVTALLQALCGGIGLALAGVPFPVVLTVVMFVLAIAQLGAPLVLVPAVGWLYWNGNSGWGTFLLLWTVLVSTMDNVVRPVLIRRGADLPLLLIFAGVVGGLMAFGLIGIFVGPVVLAVAYTLLGAWIREETDPAGPRDPERPSAP